MQGISSGGNPRKHLEESVGLRQGRGGARRGCDIQQVAAEACGSGLGASVDHASQSHPTQVSRELGPSSSCQALVEGTSRGRC